MPTTINTTKPHERANEDHNRTRKPSNPTFEDLLEDLARSYTVSDVGEGEYLLEDDRFSAWSGGVSGYIEDQYGPECLDRFEVRTDPDIMYEDRWLGCGVVKHDGPVIIRERTPEQIETYRAEQRRNVQALEQALARLDRWPGAPAGSGDVSRST